MTNELDIRKRIKEAILFYLKNFDIAASQEETLRQISIFEKQRTGLEIRWLDDLSERDGQYLRDKKLILLNKNINYKPRVLFTAYHELMHYLLENIFEDVYSIYLDTLGTLSESKYKQSIEDLCNYGAGIFLVPDSRLELSTNTLTDGQELYHFVQNCGEVSAPALLCRLSYEVQTACIFIIFREGVLQNSYDGNRLLGEEPATNQVGTYVEYAFNSQSHSYPLKRFYSISKNHILNFRNMIKDATHNAEKCFFPYSQTNKEIPAWVTGYRLNDRYFGVLYAEKPMYISKEQITLF